MNDWNRNGKYDAGDSYVDYHLANSNHSASSSDWWKYVLLFIIMEVCPPLGVIIVLGIIIFGK